MPNQWSVLHVTVRDPRTKAPMPARIRLKRADGTCYVPPAESEVRSSRKQGPQVILYEHFRDRLHLCKALEIQSSHLASGGDVSEMRDSGMSSSPTWRRPNLSTTGF